MTPTAEDQRKPPSDALWSLTIETRFGPDFVWFEPAVLIDGSIAVDLVANETTDPLDGWRQTDMLLKREHLMQLRTGVNRALAWIDKQEREANGHRTPPAPIDGEDERGGSTIEDPRGWTNHPSELEAMVTWVDEGGATQSGEPEAGFVEIATGRRGIVRLHHRTTARQIEAGGIATFRRGSTVHWIDG